MDKQVKVIQKNVCNGGGAVYGLGLIGSLVYFLQQAASFNEVIAGIFKAIFWPAFLVYRVLVLLEL